MSYIVGGVAEGTTYTVVRGDTLDAIAKRFGTTYQELARINKISDPDKIDVGLVLRLKDTAVTPTTPGGMAPSSGASSSETVKKALTVIGIGALVVGGLYVASKVASGKAQTTTA